MVNPARLPYQPIETLPVFNQTVLFIIKFFSMAITMQGSWTVSFKSKSAAHDQRFIVAGAGSGNNTYDGVPGKTAIVSGQSWTITVQHRVGSSWQNSRHKITSPVFSGSLYRFDIQSEDSTDDDFNDLVLTCSTAATSSDFIIHGNVSYYSELCWYNRCFPRFVVIDTPATLREAIKNKPIYDIVKKLYPDRLKSIVRTPNLPDPPPDFTPVMLPLFDETALPSKVKMEVRSKRTAPAGDKKAGEAISYNQLISANRIVERNIAPASLSVQERLSLGLLIDKYRHRLCETGALPYAILNFQEYDRTNSELTGGPYTGLGDRQPLGFAVADEFGNYIFRFSRTLGDVIDEIVTDTASDESTEYTVMPDILVQLKDATNTNNVLFETALYPDVPFLKHIDLCIPKSKTGLIPFPCNGQSIIQRVGNTVVGPLFADGTRHDAANDTFLTRNGIISINHNGSLRYPISPNDVKCCAWGKTYSNDVLALWGCLSHPDIKNYIVRYKKHSDADLPGNWKFITDGLSLPYYAYDPVTNAHTQLVNLPVSHVLNLVIDGVPVNNAPAFRNIETDPDPYWMNAMRNLKATLTSANYTTDPGPVDFKIEGFDATGHRFASASEVITLYIDNTAADLYLDPTMQMDGIDGNDCSLYTLPAGDPATPLTVHFRAVLKSGFMKSYELYMQRGATNFPIKGQAGENIARSYADSNAALCSNNFRGTIDEIAADVNGDYTVHVQPATGDWLTPEQTFCAFGVHVHASIRRTDGNSAYPGANANPSVVIGIQK